MLLTTILFRILLEKWYRDRNINKSDNLYYKKLSSTVKLIISNNAINIEIDCSAYETQFQKF